MFRIGLDVSALAPDFKEHALRGIGRYVLELKKYFETARSDLVEVKPFRVDDFHSSSFLKNIVNKLPYGRQTIAQQLVTPLSIAAKSKKQFDLIHFTAHMDAPAWSLREYILTVHDIIPLVCADLYKASPLRFHVARTLEGLAIKNAKHIICVSQNSSNDIQKHLGIPAERISVIHLGIDKLFFNDPGEGPSIRERYQIKELTPIISYVGGIDPRKNTRMLIDVFKEVFHHQKAKGAEPPMLVLAGKIKNDREYEPFKKYIAEAGVSDAIKETGYINDKDLVRLYRESTLFFFPSLYEGFGFPPLEALATGCPVVSTNTSSLPEILGSAAMYVNPTNKSECIEKVVLVLNNEDIRRRSREAGPEQAKKFVWEKTGRATLDVYQKLGYEN